MEKIEPEHLKSINKTTQTDTIRNVATEPLAIIVHVFYEKVFLELLHHFGPFENIKCKLFVGTTKEKYDTVKSMLNNTDFNYHLAEFENRGRDILPFLRLSEIAVDEKYPLILKLHTKKSNHRLSGELWRKEVYEKLLNYSAVERIIEVFLRNPNLGLLGPAGHIVPINLYYGSNALAIGYLGHRLGIEPQDLKNIKFIAGSMFYIRSLALMPLLALKLDAELFEKEMGQHDGTMAHAIERIIAVSNFMAGFDLADSTSTSEQIRASVTKDHAFTW